MSHREDGDLLELVVKDDGAGVDIEALKERCVERGVIEVEELADLGDEDALDLVFRPGVSTTEEVTAISGRGVGMDIIRSIAEQHGGAARLNSVPGQGSELTCTLSRLSHAAEVFPARRRHVRRPVYYYLLVRDEAGGEFGRLLDASVSGAMIAHVPEIAIGDGRAVTIHQPDHLHGQEFVSCRVTCRWTKVAPSRHGHVSGFSLDELPQEALADFDRMIMKFGISGNSMLYADTADQA